MPDMVYNMYLPKLLSATWKTVFGGISAGIVVFVMGTHSAVAASTIIGTPLNCQKVQYIALNQKIGGAMSDVSHACGFTAMVGDGLNQQVRTGSYAGNIETILSQFNQQQPLHWGRINNTLYADDAARSGSASIELKAMSRAAFEQTLTNNRISVDSAQVIYESGSNVYRINGPVSFVTDLEQTLSNIRSRASVSTNGPSFQGIRVIKFGVISSAAN